VTLLEKQFLMTRCLADLLEFAHARGYAFTLGDAYRDPRAFGEIGEEKLYSHAYSNHKRRLAIDLNLFKDGEYLTETKDHEPLGLYWESLHPLCAWGGHFNDGNHYAIQHEGIE